MTKTGKTGANSCSALPIEHRGLEKNIGRYKIIVDGPGTAFYTDWYGTGVQDQILKVPPGLKGKSLRPSAPIQRNA